MTPTPDPLRDDDQVHLLARWFHDEPWHEFGCTCPGWRAHVDLARAALAQPAPPLDDLGTAWAEVEAALPEGWAITMLWGTVTTERWGASAGLWPSERDSPNEFGGGATPSAALRQLAAGLAERDRSTGSLTLDQLRARVALSEPQS